MFKYKVLETTWLVSKSLFMLNIKAFTPSYKDIKVILIAPCFSVLLSFAFRA